MAEYLPLSTLMSQGRPSTQPVALRAGTPLDFATFAAEVEAWQASFTTQGGKRFALYMHDATQFAAALFGAWHAGACVYLLPDTTASTLAGVRPCVDGYAGDIPGVPRLAPLPQAQPPHWTGLDPSHEGLMVYTSGSTGLPQAIPKRLGQLFSEVESLEHCFGARLGDSTVLATVSHQHIYGLLCRVLWPLATARPFQAERLAFAEDIAYQLAQHTSCTLISSPAHLKRLPAGLPWSRVAGRLLSLFSSGGPLPVGALQDCLTLLGQAPIEIYGSSETGGIAWRQRNSAVQDGWRPLPGVELLLEGGQLAVRSPYLPDTTWFNTLDQVQPSADGFTLLGRSDRIVKIEEKRVSLRALEHALERSPLLEEARVLASESPRQALVVVARPSEAGWQLLEQQGKRALNQQLRQALAGEAEGALLPRRWRYVSEWPANAQGKVSTAALLALFAAGRPTCRLLERSAERLRLRLYIAPELPYFDGHFPGAPILPGVVQIDWAILFGREWLALSGDFQRLEQLKFQQVITPHAELELELHYQREKRALDFSFRSTAGVHASGRAIFGEAP